MKEKSKSRILPYSIGQKVRHRIFGQGIIVGRTGLGSKTKLTISFSGNIRKTLLAKLANLEKL